MYLNYVAVLYWWASVLAFPAYGVVVVRLIRARPVRFVYNAVLLVFSLLPLIWLLAIFSGELSNGLASRPSLASKDGQTIFYIAQTIGVILTMPLIAVQVRNVRVHFRYRRLFEQGALIVVWLTWIMDWLLPIPPTVPLSFGLMGAGFYGAMRCLLTGYNQYEVWEKLKVQNRSLILFSALAGRMAPGIRFSDRLQLVLSQAGRRFRGSFFRLELFWFSDPGYLEENYVSRSGRISYTLGPLPAEENNYFFKHDSAGRYQATLFFTNAEFLYSRFLHQFFTQLILHLENQAAYLAMLRQNVALEEKVKDRTRSLSEAHQELQLEKDNQERWFHAINHDLKTPLTNMRGRLDMLLSTAGLDERRRERLLSLERSVEQMDNLIQNLLWKARIDKGWAEIEPEAIEVVEIIEDVNQDFVDIFQRKGLKLEVDISPGQKVQGHRELLRRVIANLFSNISRYAQDDSTVSIQNRIAGGCIRLRFINRCPPFTRHSARQLFQLPGSGSSVPGSSGLGLGICRELVEAMGGRFLALPAKDGLCLQATLAVA